MPSLNPLQKAALNGHVNMMKHLLSLGALVNEYEGDSPLHYAARSGSSEIVRLLTEAGAYLEFRSMNQKETPLHWAAKYGKLSCFKELVLSGANLEAGDDTYGGRTPLHTAVSFGHIDIVRYILDIVDFANIKSKKGITPLFYAVKKQRYEVINILLEKGADINAKVPYLAGIAALHCAVSIKDEYGVKLLLERGADPSICCDVHHQTPLHLAAKLGHYYIVNTLAAYGSDISKKTENEMGHCPIHFASALGHLSIVHYLVRKGVDPDCINRQGYTPLHIAAYFSRFNIVRFLLDKNVDVRKHSVNTNCLTALHLATYAGNLEIIKVLMSEGADINAEDGVNRYTPLHFATIANNPDSLSQLVDCGGDVMMNLDRNHRESLLLTAVKRNSARVAEWLIDKGVPLDSRGTAGMTPLHYACLYGYVDTVKILLDRGADVDVRDDLLITPLHASVSGGHVNVTELLVRYNADAMAQTTEGVNPLHYAAMKGNLPALQVLLQDLNHALIPTGDVYGNLLMHIAAAFGYEHVVKWLLSLLIHVDSRSKLGVTALVNAAWGGHYDLVLVLLEHGADVKTKVYSWDHRTPLHSAVMSRNLQMADLLIGEGADINACTSTDNSTPLHWAVLNRDLNMTRLLVNLGADTGIVSTDGMTPSGLAAYRNYYEIVLFFCGAVQ